MRKALVAAVAATAIATPAAIAAKPTTTPAKPANPGKSATAPGKVKAHPVTYVFKGVLTADAVAPTADAAGAVTLNRVSGNVFARRAVLDATVKAPWKVPATTSVTLKLDAKTVVRGKVVENGVARPATAADLTAGDTVILVIRAAKRTPLADLSAAKWINERPAAPAPSVTPAG